MELLQVSDLSVTFPHDRARLRVVDGVSFSVQRNEVLGLVGESGSGKTVTASAVMKLNRPPAVVESGRVLLEGQDLLSRREAELTAVRGSRISMIFQSPRSSLNPLMKVGDQIARVYAVHADLKGAAIRTEVLNMLRLVGIPDPDARYAAYPHQLSGGMCQRVMIAMALACKPELLIADEPTTGLDVTIEAQIFDLIRDLRAQIGMSVLLITHDLGVVAENCHRVAVMHAGHVVETADVQTIFREQKHPYSVQLFGSVLRMDQAGAARAESGAAAPAIDYTTTGCRYAGKCPAAMPVCFARKPQVAEVAPGHTVMCHLYGEVQ